MGITFKARQFYPDELQLLKSLKTQKEKQSSGKIRFYHYAVAGISGAACTYITATLPDNFWTFLFGTIAIFSFGFIVFTPYEIYKQAKRNKHLLQQLNASIERGTVDTSVIHSKRIAVAKEYEDEGDLYIIEHETDRLLYLWDNDYNLQEKFPCLDFEIYENDFYKICGTQVYPLSHRIKPLTIDKNAKWKYMSKVGVPGNLETESKSFDKLIKEYTAYT